MNKALKFFLISFGLFLTPIILTFIDVTTGVFGGGPGDANIGLGVFGFLLWLVAIFFLIKACSQLRKNKNRQ